MKNLLPFYPSQKLVCCNFIFSYKGFLSGQWKRSQTIPRIRWIRATLGSLLPFCDGYHWMVMTTQRPAWEMLFLSTNPKKNLRFFAHSVSSLPLAHPTLALPGEGARIPPSQLPGFSCPLWLVTWFSHLVSYCDIKMCHGIWLTIYVATRSYSPETASSIQQ